MALYVDIAGDEGAQRFHLEIRMVNKLPHGGPNNDFNVYLKTPPIDGISYVTEERITHFDLDRGMLGLVREALNVLIREHKSGVDEAGIMAAQIDPEGETARMAESVQGWGGDGGFPAEIGVSEVTIDPEKKQATVRRSVLAPLRKILRRRAKAGQVETGYKPGYTAPPGPPDPPRPPGPIVG